MKRAGGRGRRPAGEEVNRFFAWELCPCREFSELSLTAAQSPSLSLAQPMGTSPAFWCFFFFFFSSLVVPPPGKASQQGTFTALLKDHSLALSRETAMLPGEDPNAHFSEEESNV